jgi:hypothetical protein
MTGSWVTKSDRKTGRNRIAKKPNKECSGLALLPPKALHENPGSKERERER